VKSMKYSEIISANRELGGLLSGEEYNIVLLSNIVINQLKEILEFVLRSQGINATVTVGNYDNIVQDSSRFSSANAVIVFWEAANLSNNFHSRVMSLNSDDVSSLTSRVENEISLVLNNLRHVPLVLINSFSSLLFSVDELRAGPLGQLCKSLNASLVRHVTSNQLIVDLDVILARVGLAAAADYRQYMSFKALYSLEFLKAYSDAVEPVFQTVTGRSRKVIVLDCDNTLWGGVLGEDGESGIEMGDKTIKGKAFQEVQYILKGLRKQGVLLALSSKNNPEDVDGVLAMHPDIVLTNEDLVVKKVNWQDKATNLRELASELNLGLDSFIFVDDSSFEIGLIKKELPQVMCVQVPKVLSEYPSVMRHVARRFFTFSQTADDLRKTEQYFQEHQRKQQAAKCSTTEDYLASLGLRLNISWDKDIPVARSAQMTQKTNQFNLTTRRYTEGDIQRMLDDPMILMASFSVEDQYGDYGVTGLAIMEKMQNESETAQIDSLLMSCRVIGRNVEYAFFDRLIEKVREIGVKSLYCKYLKTQKNSQVVNFYDGLGFNVIKNCDKEKEYTISLGTYRRRNIPYINVIERNV